MVDPGMALVSIVVPLFNEELNLQLLHDGLTLALQQMLRLYEIVYVEKDCFPYANGVFSVVLFCEMIEHLTEDPLKAPKEIQSSEPKWASNYDYTERLSCLKLGKTCEWHEHIRPILTPRYIWQA